MRIAILNEFFYPDMMGGTPKVLSEAARALRDEWGDDIVAIASRNSYRDPSVRFEPDEDWDGVRIRRVPAPHWTAKGTAQRLLGNLMFTHQAERSLSREKVDVVLVSTAPGTLPMAARTYGRRKKVPYVYIVYDLDPDRAVALGVASADGRPARMLRKHQREWLHGASRVIAIGRCVKEHLAKEYGVPQDRIDVVEVGADPDTVRPASPDSAFRRKHGLSRFLLVYTGNFGKYHDFDTVLDAAKLLRDKGVTFVLVGRGAKKAHLEQRVKDEDLSNVRFFDFVPEEEYSDLLASADACLVTLEAGMEGLCVPSKFYSILASGRPTVATMNPGSEIAYVLQEAGCGVRVGLGDPQGLADALLKLEADPEGCVRMGKAARAVFDAKYATPIVTRKLRETLEKAAKGGV